MNGTSRPLSVAFACSGLKIGGVQRSLLALLESLPPTDFNITLITDTLEGDLAESLPATVEHVVASSDATKIPTIMQPRVSNLLRVLQNPRWILPLLRYFATRPPRNRRVLIEQLWKRQRPFPPSVGLSFHRPFDAAISFSGFVGVWNQVVIDCIPAKRKICWVHGDYRRLTTHSIDAEQYCQAFDDFVTVSPQCAKIISLEEPELVDRVHVIHNIISRNDIIRKSRLTVPNCSQELSLKGSIVQIISVGRLVQGKGYAEGIRAVDRLSREGLSFRWTIIGDSPERIRLEEQVRDLGLCARVRFLGEVENPLPYVVRADVFFHPSRSEGHSIAIEEARVLGKPVVATAYATVVDQVWHEVDGLVVGFGAAEMADGLRRVIVRPDLRDRMALRAASRPPAPDPSKAFSDLLRSKRRA